MGRSIYIRIQHFELCNIRIQTERRQKNYKVAHKVHYLIKIYSRTVSNGLPCFVCGLHNVDNA